MAVVAVGDFSDLEVFYVVSRSWQLKPSRQSKSSLVSLGIGFILS
jgi:hypothetical protein